VPDKIVIEKKKLPLHEIIWDIVIKDVLTDHDRDLLLSLEEKLNKKFEVDVQRIRYNDTMENQAIYYYCEALGLLRAIITLNDII
jgi:hypothetical protein